MGNRVLFLRGVGYTLTVVLITTRNLNTGVGVKIVKSCAESITMAQGSHSKFATPGKQAHNTDSENRIINLGLFLCWL